MESLEAALARESPYREIDGKHYVLVTKATKEMLGASDDALQVVYMFLKAYRPNDTDLHDAIRSLFRGAHD